METSIDDPPSFILAAILNSPASYYIFSSIILVIMLLMSALVSGSEVAFFSLKQDQLKECAHSDSPNDKSIITLLKNPKRLLATILILNNTINVAIVTQSTFLTWRIAGGQTTEGRVIVILTLIVTFFIVFVGEVIPKVYATQNNLTLTRITGRTLEFFNRIFKPLSSLLMTISNLIERRVEKKGYDISMQELNKALEIATEEHTTDEEKDIIKGIVAFGTISVKQVMRSRLDITAVDMDLNFHELLEKVTGSNYSRIPVYSETIDKIEGILYIKDLIPHLSKDPNFAWQKLLRPGYFVPENKKIDSLLRDFQEKRVHMAIVVDEYGGTSGVITLEDVIEEIVGEINDEFDDEDVIYRKLDEKTYVFEGKTSLNDFCKIVGEDSMIFDEVKGDSESLGGLILELHGKMPNSGDTILFKKFVFTVVSVDVKRIKKVRVLIKKKESELQESRKGADSHLNQEGMGID